MAEDKQLEQLIKQRGIHKASITRVENYINNPSLDAEDTNKLKIKLELLDKAWLKYEEVQFVILSIDNSDVHEKDMTVIEDKYCTIKAKIQRLLDTNADTTASLKNSNTPKLIALPKISLPNFSGDYSRWIAFRDIFENLIIQHPSLSDIQRFHYLMSSLLGEARSLIENLPPSNDNFMVAWKLISERYNNPKLIIEGHVKALLKLPSASKESALGLRNLINYVKSNLNAIQAFKDVKVPLHELLISQLILKNVDDATKRAWEIKTVEIVPYSLEELFLFLENRSRALENLQVDAKGNTKPSQVQPSRNVKHAYITTKSTKVCVVCKLDHPLYKCREFIDSSLAQKQLIIKKQRLCFNCLNFGHTSADCTLQGRCKNCNGRHHTLLHKEVNESSKPLLEKNQSDQFDKLQGAKGTYCSTKGTNSQVLLATALVKVSDSMGEFHTARALLDSASQCNFVTESFVQKLRLTKYRNNVPIHGIKDIQSEAKHCVSISLHSDHSPFQRTICCSVLPRITGNTPNTRVDVSNWGLPSNIPLADPLFNVPDRIDLLIGAELYFELLIPSQHLSKPGYPTLVNTHLGWILSGIMPTTVTEGLIHVRKNFLIKETSLQEQLQRFWEIEEIEVPIRDKHENYCEEHFVKNTTRDVDGRFIVRLPFKDNPLKLGDTLQGATARLLKLETRLSRNPELKRDYTDFLTEYEELKHMTLINSVDEIGRNHFFLPHHPVIKESTTTRVRVVFDASFKSSSGLSLNDVLHVGPTIQEDLSSIVLRFRTYQFCFTADIAKMYRQILVNDEDTKYQCILWRRTPEEPISMYKLKTVTYGTSSAPFLATRCLQELAKTERHNFSLASQILMKDLYMDDCMSGRSSLEEAIRAQNQLINLLHKGGFHIRKWSANHQALLDSIPEVDRETQFPLQFGNEGSIKALGLRWHPGSDKLQISFNVNTNNEVFTKRSVLSAIASIFDPLGLISPIVITCKIFLQELWTQQLQWDELLPIELQERWKLIFYQLHIIDQIRIDRCLTIPDVISEIQLHGFSDASEKAYGACLYLRCLTEDGRLVVRLMCSKSRVAPLRKISLPRLELCGALLLARLYRKCVSAVDLQINQTFLWTDSKIVLAWLSAPSGRWKTFVANRTSEIHTSTEGATWNHVASLDNPADLISRGVPPKLLKDNQLWWQGPHWLLETNRSFQTRPNIVFSERLPEERKKTVLYINKEAAWEIPSRYSELLKLKRVIAYAKRFINACKRGKTNESRRVLEECETFDAIKPLEASELRSALNCIIKGVQRFCFARELRALKSSSELPKDSELHSLTTFIDKQGMLRVGGRLNKSLLPFESKFQIILPSKHHLTNLIILQEHNRLLHAGQQLLISSLRQTYWIPRIRTITRNLLSKCLVCFRLNARAAQQQMGTLPEPRVRPARPFLNTGVDYAGPLILKVNNSRSKLTHKAYVAVFICLSTKAVHLELVMALTSEAFIAAFRRLISRRGRCVNLYSDNGTNFIGANNILRELGSFLRERKNQIVLQEFAAQEDFTWHFIPPSAPHFGGLWEAAVKSMKFHLRRVVGNRVLTMEEMTTLLCQVEACMNSRPITPFPSNPFNFSFLTPGHLLIGEALTSIPDPNYAEVPANRLSRWQQIQQVMQLLWKYWSTDYLHTIQQRSKWKREHKNLVPGTMVLIMENTPPLHWRVGIIEAVHPGEDKLVRVVTVRTSAGATKRPIHKLCPFPE